MTELETLDAIYMLHTYALGAIVGLLVALIAIQIIEFVGRKR